MTGADMLAGRAVLVSGGRGGIGAAIAQELAARGACVYVAGRPGSPGSGPTFHTAIGAVHGS
jgi:NAD(P)-dependent dehydrogenase (short-subunit alcohol dehydrogenase family)